MAVLSSTRKKWLAAALVFGAVTLAAAALRAPVMAWLEGRRICQALTEASKDADLRLFYFTDASKHPSQSQLDPGTYRLTLTSDCYLAQCTFEELDLPDLVPNLTLPATDPCRGQPLVLWSRDGSVGGFSAPAVLEPRRMVVRIERNGRVLWAGTPGLSCTERGFCVEAYPPEQGIQIRDEAKRLRWGEARKPVATSGRSSKFDYVYAHDSLVELSAEVARSRIRQDAPGFKRFALTRRAEGVVIDLVHEKTLQLATEKPTIDGVVVDPREEILANKLTVLVGRMEVPAVSQ